MLSTKDKLNKIKEEPEQWSRKLNEIETGMESFEIAKSKNLNAEQCLNAILPTYWEIFHTHNTYEKQYGPLPSDLKYDVGIFLVGFSTLPIILSLAEIQPTKEVYFLYSKETKPILQEISNRINSMLPNSLLSNLVTSSVNNPNYALKIRSSSDPVQTFKRIKEVIGKVGNKRIALDLTGGKKTMLGGGFTGGAILGLANSIRSSDCDMFYVDSLEYDPLKRAPTHGTEFLNLLENPYDIYNVQSVQQAHKLFEKHNYEAAADLWENVRDTLEKHKSKYGLETEFRQAVDQYRMAKCYSLWDSFNYSEAKANKGHLDKNWGYFEKHVHNSIDVLDILSKMRDRETLFENEARIIHYAVDRYQNGMRRKESGKLEDAIVRFAQVIEMICAYRIYRLAQEKHFLIIGVDTPYTELPATEKWEFKNLINQLFKKNTSTDVSGMRTCYLKNDKKMQARDYDCQDVDQIIKVIQPRNNFMHFNNPQKPTKAETDTEKLRELAHKFLKNFLEEYRSGYSLDLDDLLELHGFRRLTE